MKYLIWSAERGMWWKLSRYGYTKDITEAGQFSEAEAIGICNMANKPHLAEMMVPLSSIEWKIFADNAQ